MAEDTKRNGSGAGFFRSLSFKLVVSYILLVLLGVVVVLALIDLAILVFEEIMKPPFPLVKVADLQELLGNFLNVMIAFELLDSVRAYIRHRHFHVETVVLVSILAVARKVIVLDIHELAGLTIIGIAAIFVALCGGYFLLRRCPPRTREEEEHYEATCE